MLFHLPGGPRARKHHSDFAGDSSRLRDPGLFAWSLIRGVARFPSAPRRPHRGGLPDIDASRVEPDTDRRRLLFWLIPGAALLPRLLLHARQADPPAGPAEKSFGETAAAPYIVESEESVGHRSAHAASTWETSRAA